MKDEAGGDAAFSEAFKRAYALRVKTTAELASKPPLRRTGLRQGFGSPALVWVLMAEAAGVV